jgi:hypothetical protein
MGVDSTTSKDWGTIRDTDGPFPLTPREREKHSPLLRWVAQATPNARAAHGKIAYRKWKPLL